MLEAYYACACAADPAWNPPLVQIKVDLAEPLFHRPAIASTLPRLSDVPVPDGPTPSATWYEIEALSHIYGAQMGAKDVQAAKVYGEGEHNFRKYMHAMSRLRRVQGCALGRTGTPSLFASAAQRVLDGDRTPADRMRLASYLLKLDSACHRRRYFSAAAKGLAVAVRPSDIPAATVPAPPSTNGELAGVDVSGGAANASGCPASVEPEIDGAVSLTQGLSDGASVGTGFGGRATDPIESVSPKLLCNGVEVDLAIQDGVLAPAPDADLTPDLAHQPGAAGQSVVRARANPASTIASPPPRRAASRSGERRREGVVSTNALAYAPCQGGPDRGGGDFIDWCSTASVHHPCSSSRSGPLE